MIAVLLMTALTMTLGQARAAAPDRAALLAQASAALTAGRRDEAKRLLKETADRFQSVAALLQLARIQSGGSCVPLDVVQRPWQTASVLHCLAIESVA